MSDICKCLNGTQNVDMQEKIIEIILNNKWISTNNKQNLTIDDKNKLKNYYYYLVNNKDLYVISKNVTSKLIKIWSKILSKNYNFYEIYFKKFPEINEIDNTNIEFINRDMPLQQIRQRFSHYFIINSSPNINYNNIEQLKNIQNWLLSGKMLKDMPGFYTQQVSIGFWTFRGWDINEAKKRVSEIQSINSNKFKQKRKLNPEQYKDVSPNQIRYWLKQGYSEDESIKKVKERQSTFTLEKCIQKYGEIEGRKRFEERQKKWQNTLQSKDDYLEIIQRRVGSDKFYSQISQELFNSIKEKLDNLNINVQMYYQLLNCEWGFEIKKHGWVLYDFVIPELKYAIEFNGNVFHPNKEKLSKEEFKNWTNPWGKTAKELYKFDTLKNNVIIKKGFILDIVWEDEYKNNKQKTIDLLVDKIVKIYNTKYNYEIH